MVRRQAAEKPRVAEVVEWDKTAYFIAKGPFALTLQQHRWRHARRQTLRCPRRCGAVCAGAIGAERTRRFSTTGNRRGEAVDGCQGQFAR